MHFDITGSEYLLIFRGEWDAGLTPEQTRELMDKVHAWFSELQGSGKITAANVLGPDGVVISKAAGRTDGPFAESKEVVGGYCILVAESMEEATNIVLKNPTLKHGTTVEIRPLAAICPVQQRVDSEFVAATSTA